MSRLSRPPLFGF
uniref:Uncharacterized protein n=1 Tax=Lepeophtheirus salmonis TaxID=72036 RepID=A0A0K2VLH9_LEPSM